MEKLSSWFKYYFGAFFSHERSKECEWRNGANTALSMLLAFVLLMGGLIAGYRLSFGHIYGRAEEFKSFAYGVFDVLDAEIKDGEMTSQCLINTYDNQADAAYAENGYNLIADFRDTRKMYDDFTVICSSESRPEISYEDYLNEPAHIQRDYTTFRAQYSGNILDVTEKYDDYHAYLTSVTQKESASYKEAVAEAFSKLEAEKPADYYEQVYLLYVDTYYPELVISENNAQAPTLHGYYYNKIANDKDGEFIALFKDICYISFVSDGNLVFYVGDYSQMSDMSINGNDAADMLIRAAFNSTAQTDFMMYGVNLFGIFAIIIAIWIILTVVFALISRKREIEETRRFGSASLLVGTYMWFSAVIGSVFAIVGSFFMSQSAAFYLTCVVFVAAFIVRSIVFLSHQSKSIKNAPSEIGER